MAVGAGLDPAVAQRVRVADEHATTRLETSRCTSARRRDDLIEETVSVIPIGVVAGCAPT